MRQYCPFPKATLHRADLASGNLSHRTKDEQRAAFPATVDAAGETHFHVAAPRVLRRDLHDRGGGGGREEFKKEAGKITKGH